MRIVLHIGGAKCGSSALQRFFASNWKRFKKNGILIPGKELDTVSKISGNQLWFFESLLPFDTHKHELFLDRLLRLRETAEADGLSTILISGENLVGSRGFHKAFDGVVNTFEVDAILYARRQDDYIISAWQQWYLKRGEPLSEFLRANIGRIANWNDLLLPWERVLGENRIRVRRYGSIYLQDGDVVSDFMTTMKLAGPGYQPLTGGINISISEVIGRMGHRIPDVFKNIHDNRFYRAMTYAIGDKAFKTKKQSSLLSLEQRLAIMEAYVESNNKLKAKYFPELGINEPLFSLPTLDDVISLTPEQELAEEHELLIRAVFRMAEKISTLEKEATESTKRLSG